MRLAQATFRDVAQKLDETLARVAALGLDWKTTRFGLYKQRWDVAANRAYPRVVSATEFEDERYFFEAASQCQQLIRSSEIWDTLDSSILKEKLHIVMCGQELPPVDNSDDKPRNYLLELMTAAMLKRQNFSVYMTRDDADVIATGPGLPSFAVECKRPAHVNALDTNIRRLRKQLAVRCEDGLTKGMAVVGIDRVVNLAGSLVAANTIREAETIIISKTTKMANQIKALASKRQFGLIEVPFGAVILTGTVYIRNEAKPYTIEQLVVFPMNEESRWQSLVQSVAPYFRR